MHQPGPSAQVLEQDFDVLAPRGRVVEPPLLRVPVREVAARTHVDFGAGLAGRAQLDAFGE